MPSNSRLPRYQLLPLTRRAAATTAAPGPPAAAFPPPRPSSVSPGVGASRSRSHRGGGCLPVTVRGPPHSSSRPGPLPLPLPLPLTAPTARPPPRLADSSRLSAAGTSQARPGGKSRPLLECPPLPTALMGVVVGLRRPRTTGPREQWAGSVRWRPTWLPRARCGRSPPPCGAAEGFSGWGRYRYHHAEDQVADDPSGERLGSGRQRGGELRALPGGAVPGPAARGGPGRGAVPGHPGGAPGRGHRPRPRWWERGGLMCISSRYVCIQLLTSPRLSQEMEALTGVCT